MAAELIQLAFGALTVRQRDPERGVRLRDVAPPARSASSSRRWSAPARTWTG